MILIVTKEVHIIEAVICNLFREEREREIEKREFGFEGFKIRSMMERKKEEKKGRRQRIRVGKGVGVPTFSTFQLFPASVPGTS